LAKSSKTNTPPSSTARTINVLLVVGALVFTSLIIWYTMKGPAQTQTAQREGLPKPSVVTLDPMMFSGRARTAYEAAREVPEVLAQLPCYCGCMSGFGHRNNLDCFHDEHGVECTMCQDIAIDARDFYKNGIEITRIRQLIKDKYGRYASLQK
jgi:Protein of unknown function with PCYCGC motif